MKVLDARVNWNEGWGNRPELELLVDRIPETREMRFEAKPIDKDGSALYFAEFDGSVEFYAHSMGNHNGFGGWTFDVTMKDGSKQKLQGPWSSRAGAMNREGFKSSADVCLTDDPKEWKAGRASMGGHVTVELALAAVKQFLPTVTAELVVESDEPILRFSRVQNACTICKGAGKYTPSGSNRIQRCPHCNGTGHEPVKEACSHGHLTFR